MSFIDRVYVMRHPADVRAIVCGNNGTLKLMLALIYKHNELASKAGYALSRAKKAAKTNQAHSFTYWTEHYNEIRAMRVALRQKLKQLLGVHGLTAITDMTCRVSSVKYKKTRGQVRRPGAVSGITQKCLHPFSDLYNEEQLLSIVLNEAIMGDAT